mgnify:CR=1 FL=1
MAQAILRAEELPQLPVDAALEFYARFVPSLRLALADSDEAAVIFEPEDHAHRAWRRAAVQELAREAAPKRVNAIEGDDDTAIAETLAFLAGAPGVTGQLLVLDGANMENPAQ